jgi:hypothetical protein
MSHLEKKLGEALANEEISEVVPTLIGYAAGVALLSGMDQSKFQYIAREIIASVYAGGIVPPKDKRN